MQGAGGARAAALIARNADDFVALAAEVCYIYIDIYIYIYISIYISMYIYIYIYIYIYMYIYIYIYI